MTELAYSFHLGRDKNKRTSARNNAKNNLSGSSCKSQYKNVGKVENKNVVFL